MADPILTLAAVVTCAHGGLAKASIPAARVRVGGVPVRLLGPAEIVTGCPNVTPGPCVTGLWVSGAARVRSLGHPVVLGDSASTTVPTGAPLIVVPGPGRVRAV
jgi:hypothetical protein